MDPDPTSSSIGKSVVDSVEGPRKGSALTGRSLTSLDKTESHLDDLIRLMNISEGWTVLEPGCGPGGFSPRLAEQVGPEGQVLSCDVSTHMIRRLRNRELPRNVLSFVSSVRGLPLREQSCDCIVYVNGFQPTSDKAQCLKEFSRILKTGGELWLAGFSENGALASNPGNSISAGLPSRSIMRDFLQLAGLKLLMFKLDKKQYVLKATKVS